MEFFKLSLLKTLYFNLYYFKGKKFPFRVYRDVKIGKMGKPDCISLEQDACRILVGKNGSFALGQTTYWDVADTAKMIFKGNATFSKGTQLVVSGHVTFGKNFSCNSNCILNAGKSVLFGDDVLIGWNALVIDGDGHEIGQKNGTFNEKYEEIQIGNHIWIASYAKILKGTRISDDSVVAMNALVSKSFEETNILIGGINKKLNTNIDWRK